MLLFRRRNIYHLVYLDPDVVLSLHVIDMTSSWSDDFADVRARDLNYGSLRCGEVATITAISAAVSFSTSISIRATAVETIFVISVIHLSSEMNVFSRFLF